MSAGRLARTIPTFAVIAAIGWLCYTLLRPRATLDHAAIQQMAANGQFQDAIERVSLRIADVAGDSEARFMRARLLLERTDVPDAGRPAAWSELALDDLKRAESSRVSPALIWLYRGKGLYYLDLWFQAEAAWNRAIALDPTIPEAGWGILEILYLEGRRGDAARLALQLHRTEPNPGDRLNLLLELLREDAIKPSAESLARLLTKPAEADPNDVQVHLALARSLARASDPRRGIEVLEQLVARLPESLEARAGYLELLETGGTSDDLARLEAVWSRLPAEQAADPVLARVCARRAQRRGDWVEAARAYFVAWKREIENLESAYQFAQAARRADLESAEEWMRVVAAARTAAGAARGLYDEANGRPELGQRPDIELFKRIAKQREETFRFDECRAWLRLIEAGDGDSRGEIAAWLDRLTGRSSEMSLDSPPKNVIRSK